MTFEEFEKAREVDLTRETKGCFDRFNNPNLGGNDKPALLLEAQFYMQELGRREDSAIAQRDFWLELSVIALICIEIVLSIWGIKLAIRQGSDQDAMMKQQNNTLSNLQKSTSDTATALNNLAALTKAMSDNTSASSQTLLSLRSTTETMNKGVQEQISLFYDPSITVSYLTDANRILFVNTGRSGLKMQVLRINGQPTNLAGGLKLISGQSTLYVEFADQFKQISSALLKGSSQSIPVEAHLENEQGKHFVLNANLFFVWNNNDKVEVHGQTMSVQPEP
jgi:hypothetical protein